jgi:hypothetical protein
MVYPDAFNFKVFKANKLFGLHITAASYQGTERGTQSGMRRNRPQRAELNGGSSRSTGGS